MWVGSASGLAHAIASVWPCFGHVWESMACVRNIDIGQISVGVRVCKQDQHA